MEIAGWLLIILGVILVLILSNGGQLLSGAGNSGCSMWLVLVILMPGLIFIFIGMILISNAKKKKDENDSSNGTYILPNDTVRIEDKGDTINSFAENRQYRLEDSNESNQKSIPDEIRQYKQLLDDGIITEEEFETKKKELLSGVR